jgi:hypothetical protein
MTLRNAPLSGRDDHSDSLFFISEKQKYFFKESLTWVFQNNPTGKSLGVKEDWTNPPYPSHRPLAL